MPLTDVFASKREVVQKANPYHDASGAFTSKDHAQGGEGKPEPKRFSHEEIQRALSQGRHDLATQMTMKNRAIERAKEKAEIKTHPLEESPKDFLEKAIPRRNSANHALLERLDDQSLEVLYKHTQWELNKKPVPAFRAMADSIRRIQADRQKAVKKMDTFVSRHDLGR